MDRTELREKIAIQLWVSDYPHPLDIPEEVICLKSWWAVTPLKEKQKYRAKAELVLALFNEEEIRKQERERIIKWGLEVCPHWSGEQTREVGVMKRDCSECWQALKEEK